MSTYLPGFIFLALVAMLFALPFAVAVREKRKAVVLSTLAYTVVGKTWAYFALGGFDLTFLLSLAGTGLVTAIVVTKLVEHFRRRWIRAA